MLFFSFQSSFSCPSQTTPSFLFQGGFQVRQPQRQVFVEDCFCCDGIHEDVFGIPSLLSPCIVEDPFDIPLTFASRPFATHSTRPLRTQRNNYTYIHDPYAREDSRLRPEQPRPSQQSRNLRRRVEIENLDEEEETEAQWHTHTFIGHGSDQSRTSAYNNTLPNINQSTSHTTRNAMPASPPKVTMAHSEYYTLLGLTPSCSSEEIKRAYRKLAMQYHPDKNPSPEAAEKFKAFSHANECLMDAKRRKIYNKHGPEAAGKPQEYDDEGNDLQAQERAQEEAGGGGGGMQAGESDGVPFKFGEGIPVGLSGKKETRWRDPRSDAFAGFGAMPEAFFKFAGRSAAATERESQARVPQQQGGFSGHPGARHGGHTGGAYGGRGGMNSDQKTMEDLYREAEELLRRVAQPRTQQQQQQQQQQGMGGGLSGHPGMGAGCGGHPGMGGGGIGGHPGMDHDSRGGRGVGMGGHSGMGGAGNSRGGEEGMGGPFEGRGGFGDGFGGGGFGGPMW